MCDDFFDDMDGFEDSMFDPSNDFEEDVADEYYIPEEELDAESLEGLGEKGKEEQHLDFLDAMILGSMIAGNAYEEGEDDKKRRQSEKKS